MLKNALALVVLSITLTNAYLIHAYFQNIRKLGVLEASAAARSGQSGTVSRPILPPVSHEYSYKWSEGFVYRAWHLSVSGIVGSSTPRQSEPLECRRPIVVAVTDTGVDYSHPALKDLIWHNPGETGAWTPPAGYKGHCKTKECNGIDDDGNGFVDDVIGWNFVNNNPNPDDTHGHGTHIAGLVAQANTIGNGRYPKCTTLKIMVLKYYDSTGVGYNNLTNTIKSFQYAVRNGANIINYSGGGSDPSFAERAAVEEAEKAGVLVVAAAGNDGHSNDVSGYYPAKYNLSNVIAVASINPLIQLLPSSNYGGKTVHVAAPGLSVLSTLPGGKFGTMSGSSQATAIVTGMATVLARRMPKFNYQVVRQSIFKGSKLLPLDQATKDMMEAEAKEQKKPAPKFEPVLTKYGWPKLGDCIRALPNP